MVSRVARDIVVGMSVAGLMLPEGVAYAVIAGLDPGRALVAGIAGGLAYALIGRSRFAIVSPTSSAAAILAATLAGLPGGAATRDGNATALVLITALIFLGLSAFRLGSLASFISRPVLRGFGLGLAVTIIVKQLPQIAGIALPDGPIWSIIAGLAVHAPAWHSVSIALGVAALMSLLGLRRWSQIPAALIVICAGIALASVFDLAAAGVAVVGPIALQLPAPNLPDDLNAWAHLVQLAAPIALILFAESWGTMRGLALKHGDQLSANRELGALGVANVASAVVQGMPVGAGFSAGSANEASGAASRLAGVTASIAVLLIALFAEQWIARIPHPVLAAVVIAALTHALNVSPLIRLFRLERDQWVAVSAIAGVLLFGVLNGMLIAVALSIATLLYDLSHPSISELGRLGDSHDFVDIARHADAHTNASVGIYRPNAPLIFANAESALGAIAAKALALPANNIVVSLEESNDLDSSAIDALGEFAMRMAKQGKRVILARAHDRVRDVLSAAGLTELARNSTYSVADAAQRAESGD